MSSEICLACHKDWSKFYKDHTCNEKDQQITRIKKALEIANTQIAILLENSECREDEDCDHCMAIGAQKQIKEVMEGK